MSEQTPDIEVLRAELATRYGFPAEDAALMLTASDEATLRAQAQVWSERTRARPKADSSQGGHGSKHSPSAAEAFAAFIRDVR